MSRKKRKGREPIADRPQLELEPAERNSRSFSIRLNKESPDANEVQARLILDEVFDGEHDSKQFLINSVIMGANQTPVTRDEITTDLMRLTQQLLVLRDEHESVVQGLNQQIEMLTEERQLLGRMLSKLKNADFSLFQQTATELADGEEEVEQDLLNSLFGLLDGDKED